MPALTMDPFDALGLPPRFDLEEEAVRRAWLERSALAHPDRASVPGDAERETAALNHARRTLEDPERRAEALLARLGEIRPPGERAAIDPAVLLEFMEAREALDAARASGDRAGIESLRAWAEDRRRRHIETVGALFERALSGEPGSEAAQRLRAIRGELSAWRYAERMLEQVDDA